MDHKKPLLWYFPMSTSPAVNATYGRELFVNILFICGNVTNVLRLGRAERAIQDAELALQLNKASYPAIIDGYIV